ncbi:MAG: SMC-Scp complex subunit ScpB [Bryobacterales bacterium]|nr:SMC-Scp complex subunit ScpB [Bryobacterales bacterium]
MMNGIMVNVVSARRRVRKPVRVRNPRRLGELTLVLPPQLRKRALRRRARKVHLPHSRPHFFKGKRLTGVEIFAKAAGRFAEAPPPEISIDAFALQPDGPPAMTGDAELRATLEAIVYVTEEPVTAQQIAAALGLPVAKVAGLLEELAAEYAQPHRGVSIRSLAGGYKMSTKPEFHEGVRRFVRSLKPPLKLSMAALETLAVIAYKQPITAPEILEIRGVQGAGVLKTLLDKKLITTAGRKNVVGRPMMYKTTREFLVQFGLNSTAELPTLKEFEELKNLALSEAEEVDKAEAGIARYEKYAEVAASVDAYAEQTAVAELPGETPADEPGDDSRG